MAGRKTVAISAAAVVVAMAASQHGPTTVAQARGMRLSDMSKLQQRLLSAGAYTAFQQPGLDDINIDAGTTAKPATYFPTKDDGCVGNLGADLRVARNCANLTDADLQGRGQAQNETAIAANPSNSRQLVASYNDYRRGDGNCGISYSGDGGSNWTDATAPTGFTRGTNFGNFARQYWQAGGDTSVSWDTKGNSYLMCQVFNRGGAVSQNPDLSSAFYVFRSTKNGGASWNFPGKPAAEQLNTSGSIVPLLDKEYLAVDNHKASPFQDRLYVTWTLFAANGTADIFEAYSSDYGQTFSSPVLVSNASALCPVSVGTSGSCDANQYSNPFTAADGTLYVSYANFNNRVSGSDNHNQMLVSKSTDGGVTFGSPVLVSNYYDLPDCATYQGGADSGRACVPEKGPGHNSYFRATNYPSGSVNPTNGHVVVTFGSYINRTDATACTPAALASNGDNLYTGVKSTCQNKILYSSSSDSGATFNSTDPTTGPMVTSQASQASSDQWFQFAAFTSSGKLAVSYYDRQYGSDENTGYSDYSLSSSSSLPAFTTVRATTGSSPPPTAFSGLFWGDYTGLAVADNIAYPIWSDTRNAELFLCPGTGITGVAPQICKGSAINASLANLEEVYTRKMSLP